MQQMSWLKRVLRLDNIDELRDLRDWRRQVQRMMVGAFVLFCPLSFPLLFPVLHDLGHDWLIAVDFLLWGWLIVMMVRTPRRWERRTVVLLLVLYALTIGFFIGLGPDEARPAWMAFAVIIVAAFYGPRAVLGAALFNAALAIGLFYLLRDTEPWARANSEGVLPYLTFVVNTWILGMGGGLAVTYLLRGLDTVIAKERATRIRLEMETARRRKLERNLAEAQKLEAIGRVSGGIAHDLLNMLAPVSMFAQLAQREIEGNAEATELLDKVLEGGERATRLAEQILAYSRGVPPASEDSDAQESIEALVAQLEPTLPENVELVVDIRNGHVVRADETPLYQVLLNLATNATAAMQETGGSLTLRVRSAEEADTDAGAALEDPACFVCFEVVDTGEGMDPETASRAFEPFFTTKGESGTGLGLATAFNIVATYGGTITCDTAPGKGTTFRVFVPRAERRMAA